MPRLVRFLVAITVAVGGASIAVSTQPAPVPVFTPLPAGRQVPAAAPFAGDPSIVREQAVGMDLGALFDGASTAGGPAAPAPRITLNVFDEVFVGVFERLDLSAQGYRSWVGTIEGQPYSHVVFTEGGGVVSGLVVAAPEGTFQVRTVEPGVYRLVESAPNQLSPEDEPPPPPTDRLPPVAADEPAGPEDGSLIDVLILYTPRARTEAGGVAQIGALAAQAASDTNTAFQRSGVTTRIRLVGVAELSFDERPTASQDLTALTLSPAAHAVRDQLGADLVQLFVHSPDVGATGYQMETLSRSFHPNAYSVTDWRRVSEFSPTHELGHNMGAHHAPADPLQGWRGLFSYSYGYKVRGVFRTIMAYDIDALDIACVCPRIPNFSNPNVRLGQWPTGTPLGSNNALTIENAAYTVANFRQSAGRYRAVLAPATLPGPSAAGRMNSVGRMVVYTGGGGGIVSMFSWQGSTIFPIPLAPGIVGYNSNHAVNDVGRIALNAPTSELGLRAFLWDGTSFRALGSLGGSGVITVALGLNNAGVVVGASSNRAVVWDSTTMRDLAFGPPPSSMASSAARAINDLGQICGHYAIFHPVTQIPTQYSVFWDGTTLHELGTGQGGVVNSAYACADLNNAGQSAGSVPTPTSAQGGAAVWTGGALAIIGGLGGDYSTATGINNAGAVVGYSRVPVPPGSSFIEHGFIWDGILMKDVNHLVDWPEPGWTVNRASDINDAGQIAATASKGGVSRAVRLDPPNLGAQLPLPPSRLSATANGNTVVMSWSAPAIGGPYTYRIEAGSLDGLADLGVMSVSGLSATFFNVPNGTYFVRVRTQQGVTLSYAAPAEKVSVGPQAPTGLTASVAGATVSFNWRAPATGATPTGYGLEAGTAPGASNIVPIAVPGTAYTAVNVPSGTYYVRVRSVNVGGTSAPSNEVAVSVLPLQVPGPPVSLAVTQQGNHVSLTWAPPATGGPVTGYRLEAGSAPSLANLGLLFIGATSFAEQVPSGTYYVRVRGANAAGHGAPSNEVVVTIP